MASAELLLHPLRLRIVQTFLGDRTLTVADLRAALDDVPPATLYRQISTLTEGGVLEVVEERRVRGTFERTYRLRDENASVDPEQVAAMSPQEHERAFTTFVAGLLADFGRYLRDADADPARDRVGYRQAAMYLTDEEVDDLVSELRAVLRPRLELPAAPHRRRRLFSTFLMPGD